MTSNLPHILANKQTRESKVSNPIQHVGGIHNYVPLSTGVYLCNYRLGKYYKSIEHQRLYKENKKLVRYQILGLLKIKNIKFYYEPYYYNIANHDDKSFVNIYYDPYSINSYTIFSNKRYVEKNTRLNEGVILQKKPNYSINLGGSGINSIEKLNAVISHELLHVTRYSLYLNTFITMLKGNQLSLNQYSTRHRVNYQIHNIHATVFNIIEDYHVNYYLSSDERKILIGESSLVNKNESDSLNHVLSKFLTFGEILNEELLLSRFQNSDINQYQNLIKKYHHLRSGNGWEEINANIEKIFELSVQITRLLWDMLYDHNNQEPQDVILRILKEGVGSGELITDESSSSIDNYNDPQLLAQIKYLLKLVTPLHKPQIDNRYIGKKLNRQYIENPNINIGELNGITKPFIYISTPKPVNRIPSIFLILDHSGSMSDYTIHIQKFLYCLYESGFKFTGIWKNDCSVIEFSSDSLKNISHIPSSSYAESFRKINSKYLQMMNNFDKILFISDFNIDIDDYKFIRENFSQNKKLIPIMFGKTRSNSFEEAIKLFGDTDKNNVKLSIGTNFKDIVAKFAGWL